MLVRTLGLNLILWLLLTGGGSLEAQVAGVGTREDDERAATVEQRQSIIANILTQARNDRDKGNLSAAAGLLNRAGRLQARLHKPDEALATYREVLVLTKANPDLFAEVDSLNGMAAIYAELSKCDEAQASLQRALPLSQHANYEGGRAQSLLTLSDCQNHSDHGLALRTAQEALTLWQSVNDKWGIAKAYMAIGDYQFSRNDLIAASRSLETSSQLWTELNMPAERAESLISLGFIEYRRGAWQESVLLLSQAQSLLDEQAEPYRMGQIAGGMAEAFIESGLPETGLEKLKLATEYFRRANSPRAVIVMYWDIGKAHYLLGDYSQALENLNTGWSEGQSRGEPIFAALCAEYLGRTYAEMGEYDRALEYYRWALARYDSSNPMEAARTIALVGQVYQRQGRVQQSKEQYIKAIHVFQRLADSLNEAATLYALGTLELQQNDLSKAEDHLRKSLEATENIRRVSTSNDLTTAFSARIQERYEGLIECLMRESHMRASTDISIHAFELSELARARSLAEFLRGTQTRLENGIAPDLAEKEKLLRQELRVKEDSKVAMLATNYRRADLETLGADIATLGKEHQDVVEKIRVQYPAYDQITTANAWDLQRIRDQIITNDETVLLEYSLGTERSYVWVITKTGFSSRELPSERDIEAATKSVYNLLKTPPGDPLELNNAIRKLSEMVFASMPQKLPKRIIVIADGVLNYLPFQVLSAPFENGEPLVANHEVVNAPSASILGQLQEEAARRPPAANLLAAFGDPVFSSNFRDQKDKATSAESAIQPFESERALSASRDIEVGGDSFDPSAIQPLFYAKRELSNLQAIAGPRTFVATGFDASRERLETANLTSYAILHFATHGILDPKRPENSGFFLSMVGRDGRAQNGFIGLQDIYSLRIPVGLVVLSACRTGLGKEVRGEGLIGLTRGFMYAGASSVVASLWKVDDEATAELMKRFYSNILRGGMSPSEALRASQNSMRQEPNWSPPYYWAAFTLQGDYRIAMKTPSSDEEAFVPYIIVGSLALLLAFLYFSHRKMSKGLLSGNYSTVKK